MIAKRFVLLIDNDVTCVQYLYEDNHVIGNYYPRVITFSLVIAEDSMQRFD